MTNPTDVPPISTLRLRPAAVGRALLLMWMAVTLGAVSAIVLLTLTSRATLADLLAIVVVVSLNAFLIDKIGAGRPWARVVLVIVFGLTLTQLVVNVATLFDRAPLMVVLGFLQNVLLAGALYLVFAPPGSRWFKVF